MQTRREFIGTAGALGALSFVPAVAATPSPVRMPLSIFATDPGRVASLRRGVAAMKALPGSDHRSWFFQAATHAYSDAALEAEMKRDPKLKPAELRKYWNQCPHFGQSSADFVIWHRAFLHNFEDVLRAMAGDPMLALPYWDYAKEDERTFPAIFAPEALDDGKPNPLFHPNREKSFVKGLVEISAAIGLAPNTVAAQSFFHEVGRPGFGGDTLDSDHTQIGLLEQRPHNDIHVAVGGVINDSNGAMAEITTAAFDPVFWVHHANIDRMWAEWASKPDKRWGPMPPDEWFDARPWLFLDVDGRERTVSRREAIALPASYDVAYASQLALPENAPAAVTEAPPPPPDTARPTSPPLVGAAAPTGGGARNAAPPRRARRPVERELLADATPITLTPQHAARRQFGAAAHRHHHHHGAGKPAGAAPPPALDAPELADESAKVLLELSGISFTRVPSSGFAVYLDSPGKPSAEPVGLIDIFGATHMGAGMQHMTGMANMPATAAQRFDVTAIVRGAQGPFTLRVEPYDLLVTKSGAPAAARGDAIRIATVRFVVVS